MNAPAVLVLGLDRAAFVTASPRLRVDDVRFDYFAQDTIPGVVSLIKQVSRGGHVTTSHADDGAQRGRSSSGSPLASSEKSKQPVPGVLQSMAAEHSSGASFDLSTLGCERPASPEPASGARGALPASAGICGVDALEQPAAIESSTTTRNPRAMASPIKNRLFIEGRAGSCSLTPGHGRREAEGEEASDAVV